MGCLGALLEIPGAIWWRFLAKLGRRWAQDGRKMGQVGSKLRPRWAMMAPRSPSWAKFGSFWGGPGSIFGHFFRNLWKNGRSVKTTNTTALLLLFLGLGLPPEGPGGCLGRVLGRYVGRLWLQDGVFLAILGDVWTSWHQGCRTRAQDAAAERKSWIFGGLGWGRDRRSSGNGSP